MERTPGGAGELPAEARHKLETASGTDLIYHICNSVAGETGADVRELPPLYETIDTDALEAFLRCSDGADTRPRRSVEFSYSGYRVVADSAGRVTLHPEPESAVPTPAIRG